MEPMANSIPHTTKVIESGRTKVYELINTNQLETIKIRNRRLFLTESLKRYVESKKQ